MKKVRSVIAIMLIVGLCGNGAMAFGLQHPETSSTLIEEGVYYNTQCYEDVRVLPGQTVRFWVNITVYEDGSYYEIASIGTWGAYSISGPDVVFNGATVKYGGVGSTFVEIWFTYTGENGKRTVPLSFQL